ncbi:penicillin-binding transpeptidase domain-containing protein [Parachlamydia sp. AcF125]|uniref:penicillin-binding transpeptidase domain-containing protein n=1 Tax=Parachlamydia sp. AcF125 TaxID=2795736 RepID=UPI001BC9B7A7|nr:penicillin-binding transpeptidase domain-containing protein [Parachlamydia sp. AcF125]
MSKNRESRRFYRPSIQHLDIPAKANRVLNVILVALLLVIIRVWHLAVIQYEDRLESASKPQKKVVLEASKRGTIRDRFNIPLAVNKIQYDAAIVYSELQQIPSVTTAYGPEGKRIKVFKRKQYIENLSQLLGNELQLDPNWIEDTIYSKAAFQYHVPFVIKRELTEQEYYRLKGLENEWLGIHVMCVPRRHYPQGKVAADIIGYMGAISREKYEGILAKISELKEFLQKEESGEDPFLPEGYDSSQQVRQALVELEEHAYTINDWVGKTGIESQFEADLRGYHGKKFYHSDARGNFLKELPGSTEPLSGRRFLLTISSELQNYAEQLLAQNEQIRKVRVTKEDSVNLTTREPWIKGGSIVAMDPNTGEILAMATYPRFDPNDFISSSHKEIGRKKRANVLRWLENEAYIADIWNRRRPFERELYDKKKEEFYEEEVMMEWEQFLSMILPPENPIRESLQKIKNVKLAVEFLKQVEALTQLCEDSRLPAIFNHLYKEEGHILLGKALSAMEREALLRKMRENQEPLAELKHKLSPYFENLPTNYDKVLLVDLCRLAIQENAFFEELLEAVGDQTLVFYCDAAAAQVGLMENIRTLSKELFHRVDFAEWRKQNQQSFLKQKRLEEKQAKQYARPYLDLLDRHETLLFNAFWSQNKWDLMSVFLTGKCGAVDEQIGIYIEHFNKMRLEVEEGLHTDEKWFLSYSKLQEALEAIPASLIPDYLKTMRGYQDLTRPLFGSYRMLRKSGKQCHLEKDLAAGFYPKYGFGYGRSQAYRQAATQGSIFKLITGYEALRQRFMLLDGQAAYTYQDLNPLTFEDRIFRKGKELFVGITEEGKPLPQHYKGGRLPKSLSSHIGKIDIKRALETSSNPYFCLLAGDIFQDPNDLARAAQDFSYGAPTGIDLPGEIAGNVPKDLASNRTGLYATAIGQHTLIVTPLQTAVMLSSLANGGKILKPKIVRMAAGKKLEVGNLLKPSGDHTRSQIEWFPTIVKKEVFMPATIRKILLEGLQQVNAHLHKNSMPALSKLYQAHPEAMQSFIELKDQIIGKSSTAESVENLDLDFRCGTNIYNHVWFGSISFESKFQGYESNRFVYRDPFGNPELVVVVYLRYGALGKEAAPLGAQMVQKWREIKNRHSGDFLLNPPSTALTQGKTNL